MQFFWGGALISCSNGSSSSDEDDDESSYGTKIYSESVTFSETPTQIVSAEMLADLSIKSLTIKVINVNYSGSDDWWFTACSDSSWSNGAKLEWQSGEDAKSLYLATITDAAAIATYKANGIYIAGTNSATASVSVFYVEGEAEESNASSGSGNNITFDGNPKELIIKSNLETKIISSITIKLSELTYSGSESSWWISIMTDTSWNNEVKISDKGTWDSNNVTYITTDSTEINLYKENGIYIAGLEGLSGTVTVSYE